MIHSWEMVPQDQSAALITRALTTEHKLEKKDKGKEAVAGRRRPSPEDRALLGNGERQGERGFPLGRARGPAATEKRGEGDPIPVGAFSHRQFSSKLERETTERHRGAPN